MALSIAARRAVRSKNIRHYTTGLTTPLAGVPEGKLTTQLPTEVESKVLANGITIVAYKNPQPLNTISLFIRAGSRFETAKTAGASHFLKRFAFKNTEKKNFLQLIRDVDVRGSELSSNSSRENLSFHVTGLNNFNDSSAETLGAIMEPAIEEYLVDRIRPEVATELQQIEADPLSTLVEAVHREAFRDQQLGNSLYCPNYQLGNLTVDDVRYHANTYYTNNRMVVVGNGTDLSTLEQLVNTHFKRFDYAAVFAATYGIQNQEKILAPLKSGGVPLAPVAGSFVGGQEVRLPGVGNSHLVVAFPGVGLNKGTKDVATAGVIQHLLGGYHSRARGLNTGSTRASRIGENVVTPNSWVQQANTFNLSYSDAGLIGVYAEAEPGHLGKLSDAIMKTIKQAENASDADVSRAKNQLKASVLTNLENREALAEFFVTNSQAGQKILTPEQYVAAIDQISTADVRSVAKAVFSTKPTVAAAGDVTGLPKF